MDRLVPIKKLTLNLICDVEGMWRMCSVGHKVVGHPAESSENTAKCAKIRKFVFGFEKLLPAAILD